MLSRSTTVLLSLLGLVILFFLNSWNLHNTLSNSSSDKNIEREPEYTGKLIDLGLPRESQVRFRRRLFLHIGPAKTATTSLQIIWSSYREELSRDGWVYGGRLYRQGLGKGPKMNVSADLDRSEVLIDPFRRLKAECKHGGKCEPLVQFRKISALLDDEESQKDMLLSHESWAQWTTQDYQHLQDLLSDLWDIHIVAGYRPFYAWLLSKKYQNERVDRFNNRKTRWLPPARGPQPIFNKYDNATNAHWKTFSYLEHSTLYVVQQVQDILPLWILPLGTDLTGTVFCDLLRAPTACSTWKNKHKQQASGASTNFWNVRPDEDDRYYDALALQAAKHFRFNTTRLQRVEVRKAIKKFQECHNETALPISCPTQGQLEHLLAYSLDMETKVLGSKKKTRLQRHRDSFWDLVTRKVFCWIDVKAIFVDTKWNEFLQTI